MMDREQIVEALVSAGVCERGGIRPGSPEQIAALEKDAGVTLPRQYREFLLAAGRGADGFFTGTDMYGSGLTGMNQDADDLLEENDEEFRLPPGVFVFSMHQGYQFHYFFTDQGDDPPVHYYCEGEGPPRQIAGSLSEYLLNSIRWHVRMREEAAQR